MKLKTLLRAWLVAATTAFLVASGGALQAASVPESKDPIIIGINEWTGQHITSYIAGHILERMGYNVEYKTAAVFPQATAIADGNITLGLELWDNNLGQYYPDLIKQGKVEDLGAVGLDAREGWLYPKHVETLCPGLPKWEAFLGCAEAFSTAETFPNGRFVEYPADWDDRATQLIAKEELPFTAIPAGSEGALVAEFKAAVTKKSPVVMMFWAPHWLMYEYEANWVDMPQDLVNKGGLQKPRVFKTGWPGMQDKWPAAYKFIKAYQIDNKVQEFLMLQIDRDGKDAIESTRKWVNDNEAYWKKYVDAATM